MRKNDVLTAIDISENGSINRVSDRVNNPELMPLAFRNDTSGGIKKWWNERSVPISQGRVRSMLEQRGIIEPGEFLVKNLGLSLTDYYWIKPVSSSLTWENVNLFENDFKENLMVGIEDSLLNSYTPNSSLQGQLEKSWQIRDGKRVLIKGNTDETSFESLNEVFASLLHKKQGYDNYTDYRLIHIKGKPYTFGCFSNAFTDSSREFVSAWAIITSEKNRRGISDYEFFIAECSEMGADEAQIRKDLEYQIMTDYILSNRDRHMNNLGVIRDADTLKAVRLAPIFDTGKSLFVRRQLPAKYAALADGSINSFVKNEKRALSLVTDRSLVDVAALPKPDELYMLYSKDETITEERKTLVCEAYEKKVDLFKQWQNEQKKNPLQQTRPAQLRPGVLMCP